MIKVNIGKSVDGALNGYSGAIGGSYGAISVTGSKNGWSGINFPGSGTLMMRSDISGFYKADDSGWRWITDNSGNTTNYGNLNVVGQIQTSASGIKFSDNTVQTTAANSSYHSYTFIINGYSEVLLGEGYLNGGNFSGFITSNFGQSGFLAQVNCGSDPMCARNYGVSIWSSGGHGGWYRVSASNIPVNTITTLW